MSEWSVSKKGTCNSFDGLQKSLNDIYKEIEYKFSDDINWNDIIHVENDAISFKILERTISTTKTMIFFTKSKESLNVKKLFLSKGKFKSMKWDFSEKDIYENSARYYRVRIRFEKTDGTSGVYTVVLKETYLFDRDIIAMQWEAVDPGIEV